MRGSFGEHLKLSIFGESHGPGIGIVIDGIPAGTQINEEHIAAQMARRAPGRDKTTTSRSEADAVELVSGVLNGRACGTPIMGLIRNKNTRSGDYAELANKMRPGHADYAGFIHYGGFADPRGGGHFSGRLTAPLVFAGTLARDILAESGVIIGSHILRVGDVCDTAFPLFPSDQSLLSLSALPFPVLTPATEQQMRNRIEQVRLSGDSIGGQIEVVALHVPAGIGAPFFGSVESVFSSLAFSVPAVKAVEFGDGTGLADMTGSEANDSLHVTDSLVLATSNHNGGITGGITNGMPIVTRVTIKPTPSISKEQQTISLRPLENTTLSIQGRHDPCILSRAPVVIESILAITLLELMMDRAATAPINERTIP